MSKQGFIKLHRQIQDHWLFDEKRKFSKFEAWVFMIMQANHKDNKFVLGNEIVELERGQFVTSELKLMETFDWGKAKLRSFLELLEKDGMIIKKSDRKKTTITICNYSVYHDYETESRPQADHEQTASRPRADTNKNVKECTKNVKNEKEEILISTFESFWKVYPKKVDKQTALKKFKSAIKKHDPQIIIDGAAKYAKQCEIKKTEKEWIKNPTTFLNAESFLNDFDLSPGYQPKKEKSLFEQGEESRRRQAEEYIPKNDTGISDDELPF
jgi:hypothetical protein